MPFPISILATAIQSLVQIAPIRENGKFFCTGVRIHKDWVLTSAHCVDGVQKVLVKNYSAAKSESKKEPAPETTIELSKIKIHQTYYDDCSFHDLALIRHTDSEQPVLALDSEPEFRNPANAEVLRLGLSLVQHKETLTKVPVQWVENKINYDPIAKNTFNKEALAMLIYKNAQTKTGHSGGPIVQVLNGKPVVIGIHSGTKGTQQKPNQFAYAATVYAHRDWIESVISDSASDLAAANKETKSRKNATCNPAEKGMPVIHQSEMADLF